MASTSTAPEPSRPVDIPGRRARSGSDSSEASVEMAETPGKDLTITPPPRVKIQNSPSATTSPILGFFFPASPTKTPGSFFGRPAGAHSAFVDGELPSSPVDAGADVAVADDDAEVPGTLPAHAHARRFSSSWARPVPTAPPADDRGAGLLRRLSLSGTFARPIIPGAHAGGTTPPQTSPVIAKTANFQNRPSPTPSPGPGRMRRSATIAVPNSSPRKARAPSPMGERILKGHFDGFV